MNPFSILFTIGILLPAIQISLGSHFVLNKPKNYFIVLSAVNLLSIMLAFFIARQILIEELVRADDHCGLPLAALTFLGLGSLAVCLIVIVIQVSVRLLKK